MYFKSTVNRVVASIVLFAFIFSLSAQERSSIEQTEVATVISDDSEDLENWLLAKVAPVLAAYTEKSGHEVCGFIAQNSDGSRYGVKLMTSNGAITCINNSEYSPEGMTSSKATIHSHPQRSMIIPSSADEAHYAENPMSIGHVIKRGRPEKIAYKKFSAGDYRNGAGYLVSDGSLTFQSGKGTERIVGNYQ